MDLGARTPEELEMLLEDAFVLRDGRALSVLFEDGVVLAGDDTLVSARGRRDVVQAFTTRWEREELFVAAPQHVLQARNTALITSRYATSVARRNRNGLWRYGLALLHTQPQPEGA